MRNASRPDRGGEPETERADGAALRREIDRLQRELQGARAELRRRDDEARQLAEREAYRFAATIVQVKHGQTPAWKLPLAALALVTPKVIREPVRSAGLATAGAVAKARARLGRQKRELSQLVELGVEQLATGKAPPAGLKGRLVAGVARVLDASRAAGDPLGVDRRVRLARPWPAERPLVSVIVPCFNYGRYVREAVDSVLAQTLQDFEIIVVEGGSTDGETPAIVRALRHPKLRVIEQPHPTRVGDNRLRGLADARGKYAVFLDADDLVAPTYLEKAAVALELTGADLAYPNMQSFGNSTDRWETGDEFTLSGMALGNMVPTVAMFRTDTWRALEIGYGSHLDLEDYDFWLRFAERGARGVKLHEDLMRYRVHGNSLTDAIRARHEEATRRILAEHAPMLQPERVARVTAAQRRPLDVPPGPDLHRCGASQEGALRIALALPWMVVGGADHLFQQLFADHRARDTRLLVYSTIEAPASMGTSVAAYARLTPDVFPLPRLLPTAAHGDAIVHLLRSRGANVLMIVGSRTTYELLPRLRAELPGLRVIDHLFNPVGHLGSNREFADQVDFQIVANEEVRRALLDAGEPDARIAVVHHGVDFERYDPARIARRDALPGLPLDPSDRLVLFSGRLSEEKGALRFLDIAAALRDREGLRFAIVGDGPQRAAVEEKVAALGLDRQVPRLGFVPDVTPYLRRADVLVVPSDVDGLPLACLEALALGVPVVASSIGALPEAIRCARDGALVAPHDVAGFAAAVLRAVETAGDARLAAERREAAAARFDIRAVRDQYWNIFREVAGAPARRASEAP